VSSARPEWTAAVDDPAWVVAGADDGADDDVWATELDEAEVTAFGGYWKLVEMLAEGAPAALTVTRTPVTVCEPMVALLAAVSWTTVMGADGVDAGVPVESTKDPPINVSVTVASTPPPTLMMVVRREVAMVKESGLLSARGWGSGVGHARLCSRQAFERATAHANTRTARRREREREQASVEKKGYLSAQG